MPFVILTRRRHLDNTTFFAFPKGVILKRENSTCKRIFSFRVCRINVQGSTIEVSTNYFPFDEHEGQWSAVERSLGDPVYRTKAEPISKLYPPYWCISDPSQMTSQFRVF
jgi:hypothetical protein